MTVISGIIVDIPNRRQFPGTVQFDGHIQTISEAENVEQQYILPGFIDSHVHIESSMLIPSQFARKAVCHGTVSTVSDPHEIANVLGIEGVWYMVDNGEKVNFKFNFGAPSCVPATPFETAGDEITANQIRTLLEDPRILYLSEMMNWPGVLNRDPEVMAKIAVAKESGKPVDGHAPGLKGDIARTYIEAGISTDHECFTMEEALDKLAHGMKIIIREGSAAKNFEALYPLIGSHTDQVMLCSDDKHPDDLLLGHIDLLVQRAVENGIDVYDVLQCACINPIHHYNLPVGQLLEGDPADFIIVEDLKSFKVRKCFINGDLVSEDGISMIPEVKAPEINNFRIGERTPDEFKLPAKGKRMRVIHALEGQLITKESTEEARIENGFAVADVSRDILKIAVVNRYDDHPPSIGFIKNFGMTEGAIASSVAHDSHNVVVIGTSDEYICEAVNALIPHMGGVSTVTSGKHEVVPLPVAGLMSTDSAETVGAAYTRADQLAKEAGCKLQSPFMTLSFMALLVIPSLKLSDKGLFDGDQFEFVELFRD